MSRSNELRVFISSTFRDLQEEREHLIKKIFPEIRSLCRQRGIRFTEVDLRWGLTDEDVALGQVIRTCLEEVDKCRPYFIGITGSRYGYVPSHLDIYKDPSLLEQYPWVEEAVDDEMSITEMEAHYAVLGEHPGKARCSQAMFYFRANSAAEQADAEGSEDSDDHERLLEYQQRIRHSGVSVEEFADVQKLGERVKASLERIIEREYSDAKPPTPLEEERARHKAFSQSRRRAYIPNRQYVKRLNEHASSDAAPLVVYAESGSGKSSLFAYWADQYRRKNPEAHVVEHYVGIGATATDHYAVIRHCCMEINERFGREDEIPSEPAKLDLALGQWLGYADHELKKRGQRMVLILDGLNQLQGTALNLKWIPDVISPSIRLILSSTVEGTLVELKKRGWGRFGMQALSEAERETIVVRYLAEYRKSLNPEQIKRIASDYKCGHPLFLKTVLEELRLVGRHEELDAKIESYLETTGTEDLFQRVLERLEEDYNMRAVRDIMVLLSASRSGLDERELSELSGLARLKIATMMAGLDYHLVRKEGRLTFFHDYLRRAVAKRYLSDEKKQRSAHQQIAEYFQSGVTALIAGGGAVPQRMASELAYQLHAAGSIDRLRECLSSMPVFLRLYDGPTVYEVLGYWAGMDAGTDIAGSYRRGLASWAMEDAGERSRGVGQVANLLARLGQWSEAIALQRERLATAIEYSEKSEEAASRRSMGWLLSLRGEHSEALEELHQALDLFTELGDRNGVSVAMGTMGYVYSSRGEYDRTLECLERQLSIAEELGNRSVVSMAIGNMGMVYSSRGEYDRTLECLERQLSIAEELGDRRVVAYAIGNMGGVYSSRRAYDRALECYERQLSMVEELGDRRIVSMAIGNMGIVYYSRGEYDRALECYERKLSMAEELGDRSGVSRAIGNMGGVYSSRGEYDRALECLERQLSIAEELGDRSGVSFAIGTMGNVYYSRGEYDRALENFQRAAEEHRTIGFPYGLTYWLQGTARVLADLVQGGEADRPEGRPRRSRPRRSRIIIMPEYLPTYVSGATEETWQAMSLQRARECAEECVTISEELQKSDTLFGGRVLLARIEAAEGRVDGAVEQLGAMLSEASEDEERAELHYWLWKIGRRTQEIGHREADRGEALRLYTALYATTPKYDYHKRIDELKAAGEQA